MQLLAQNGIFNQFFSLNPFVVALFTAVVGWGNLFLVAMKNGSAKAFLKHPGFMAGDLVMLPLAMLFIAFFYQKSTVAWVLPAYWAYFFASAAFVIAALSACRSVFVWKTVKLDVLIVPHFFFYWAFVYILATFAIRGLVQLIEQPLFALIVLYVAVFAAVAAHLLLPLVHGRKSLLAKNHQN